MFVRPHINTPRQTTVTNTPAITALSYFFLVLFTAPVYIFQGDGSVAEAVVSAEAALADLGGGGRRRPRAVLLQEEDGQNPL